MITLFHDPASPAAAVAVARMARLRRGGMAVTFEGFDPNGVDLALPPSLDALAELDGVADDAADEGVALHRPELIPPTALAHVLMGWAEGRAAGDGEAIATADAVREGVYSTVWGGDEAPVTGAGVTGGDISDPDVLVAIAAGAGLDAAEVQALLEDRVALAAWRRRMATHRREGVGGVPLILASRTLVPGLLPDDQLRVLAASI